MQNNEFKEVVVAGWKPSGLTTLKNTNTIIGEMQSIENYTRFRKKKMVTKHPKHNLLSVGCKKLLYI